jgi:hypothetical protein
VLEEVQIPRSCIFKADQWILISRFHATLIFDFLKHTADTTSECDSELTAKDLQKHRIFPLFRNVRASDEMFFPTLLALCLNGYKSLSEHEYIQRRRLTYCDWSESVHSPKTFESLNSELITKAREEQTIFLRKIKIGNNENQAKRWLRLVYGERSKGLELVLNQYITDYREACRYKGGDRSRKRERERSSSRDRNRENRSKYS